MTVLPCSDGITALPGAQWLAEVLAWVPDGVDPWVWLAPDEDDAPAMVAWYERRRFTARGENGIEQAWRQMVDWVREQPEGTCPIAIGSFPFDRSDAGFLVVPQVLIMRRHVGAPTQVFGAEEPLTRARTCWPQDDSHIAARPVDGNLEIDEQSSDVSSLCSDAADTGGHIVTSTPVITEEEWTTTVHRAVDELTSDRGLQKVVLAGAQDLTSDVPMNRSHVTAALARRFPGCWTYSADGLVGATPELLVDCRDGLFRSRVLAGTRKPEWADELLDDPKEQHEHELAVTSVLDKLADAGVDTPAVHGPFQLRLTNVVHLATDITAHVDGSNAARIVDAMHPTAAVCGAPRSQARELIAEVETLDRGRFAGPVGWMDTTGAGQWALALRCGQFSTDSRQVRLFAGAGIMPTSDPHHEWIEIGAKMQAFSSVLETQH
ncbi:isochorismate synthase MenF [Cutibacterium granulosum]|uniref:isochorismate synthase n=1 Tax=Cutibacterium granulosum TaxID=33011 RepID=UPI0025746A39|nr:chorismate-binding protein [Cutibacterium granulosum]MDU1524147.1 chorismate-binding protein [Cutibacterium granulosum]MDU7728147.1 chorismate-binding protein [Cutibacterium granulosum]MEA5641428.1 chorismate-binding protein [Cutibacterium granulosum]BDQ39908.1 isochorismate synthase [Cutibacterium granulosum]